MITRETLPDNWTKIPVGAEISEELYWDRMEILPPIGLRKSPYCGFQVSEPYDHAQDETGRWRGRYATYIKVGKKYYYAGVNFYGECKPIKLEGDV